MVNRVLHNNCTIRAKLADFYKSEILIADARFWQVCRALLTNPIELLALNIQAQYYKKNCSQNSTLFTSRRHRTLTLRKVFLSTKLNVSLAIYASCNPSKAKLVKQITKIYTRLTLLMYILCKAPAQQKRHCEHAN